MSQSSDNDGVEVEPTGTMIPVFCNTDIPTETLNQLLINDAEYRQDWSLRLRYITDYSDKAIASINDQRSKPPTETFSSPFAGKSYHQINEIYLKKFSGQYSFTNRIFFVLDSLSVEDETLVVVEARDPAEMTDDDDGIATLRTDFWVARQIATMVEVGQENLLENYDYTKTYRIHEFEMDL